VNRQDVTELHYITPIANVASILQHGLLSHHRAKKVLHRSVAMQEIQEKRTGKTVPGGRPLHDYVNLYFHARNPMLYKLRAEHESLCVLRVSDEVLDLPGVIITDENAASDYTAFYPSPDGLMHLNRDAVFAERWTDQDQIQKWRKTRAKCAEVLIPDKVEANLIVGAYVSCVVAMQKLIAAGFRSPIAIDGPLFFH